MHEQTVMFEGFAYPDIKAALAGGMEGTAVNDAVLAEIAELGVGEVFRFAIVGTVASKRYATKTDKDGIEHRVLTVTLKADGIMAGNEMSVTFKRGGIEGEIEAPEFEPPTDETALEAMHAGIAVD